jgi:hypothetical protein
MTDTTTNAIREARRSIAALLTELPEPVWREHKGVFENAVALMVGENLNIRADDERLGAALAAAEARCARLEPYEWRCLAAEQKVNDLAADLHAAERAHREAEAALAAAEEKLAFCRKTCAEGMDRYGNTILELENKLDVAVAQIERLSVLASVTTSERLAGVEVPPDVAARLLAEEERDDLARRLCRARGVLAAVLVKLDPEAGGSGCGLCVRWLRDALLQTPLDGPRGAG